MRQFAGKIPFSVREEVPLAWMDVYGTPFRVFDSLNSGNLCFGVEGRWGKLMIKYAGARTENFAGRPREAVDALRAAIPVYRLAHPAFAELLTWGEVNGGEGFAAVFRWIDGVPVRARAPAPQALEALRALPVSSRLSLLDSMFDLHARLTDMGYVSVNFHDGKLIADPARGSWKLCSANAYRKMPAVNDRGRMRGSGFFMAPEEYRWDEPLDEGTTVYHLGVLAFDLFGDAEQRDLSRWQGPQALYDTAAQAVETERSRRFPSVRAFLDTWREQVGRCFAY